MSAVESALETSFSAQLMQGGGKRRIERFPAGSVLFNEGDAGSEILLVLDGIVRVERGGERLAEYGPGRSWASAPTSRAASARRATSP